MYNEYDVLQGILKELEEIEEAKKHIPVVIQKKIDTDNNFIGKKYNMLTILEKSDKRAKNGSILYKCQCDCGNIVYYNSGDFKKNTSCGCYRKSKEKINKMKQTMKCFENTCVRVLEDRKINSNNTSGYTGVSYSKSKKKWVAYIKCQTKTINLGTFKTKREAIRARKKGEKQYFKPIIEKYNRLKSDNKI